MVIVQVLPGATGVSGVVNEQVVPVMVGTVPTVLVIVTASICSVPVPVFCTVTTAVRGSGVVNVRSAPPVSVPPVADANVSVPPGNSVVPVSVTGLPVTVAPV